MKSSLQDPMPNLPPVYLKKHYVRCKNTNKNISYLPVPLSHTPRKSTAQPNLFDSLAHNLFHTKRGRSKNSAVSQLLCSQSVGKCHANQATWKRKEASLWFHSGRWG
jgi:hypothetical protein